MKRRRGGFEYIKGHYVKPLENGCWQWEGTVDNEGYGMLTFLGVQWKAHRLFFLKLKGSLEPNKQIHHECGNKLCVNPTHLSQVLSSRHPNSIFCKHLNDRCVHGHLFDDKNTYHDSLGYRQCKICKNISAKRRRRINWERSLEALK